MTNVVPPKHSIIGLLSCVVAGAMFLLFLLVTTAFYFQFKAGRGSGSDVLGLLQMTIVLFLPVPVHLAGLAAGAAAFFFPNRSKLFPALGVALNFVFGLLSLFPWLWLVAAGMGGV